MFNFVFYFKYLDYFFVILRFLLEKDQNWLLFGVILPKIFGVLNQIGSSKVQRFQSKIWSSFSKEISKFPKAEQVLGCVPVKFLETLPN